MTNPATPSAPTPAGDDRNLVPVDQAYIAPSFEDRLRMFWEKNSKTITLVLVGILLLVAAKEGWEYVAAARERGIGEAYAAATTPAQIKSFIAENPQHPLAGAAHLRTADEAYGNAAFVDAIAGYDQAVTILKAGPLASRARLGSAIAKLQAGRAAEGEAALKAFAADAAEVKAFRAEAMYHLASRAAANGNFDEVKTYSDQLMQLDATGPWTQRALALRSTAAPSAPAPAEAAPAITLPGAAK